MILFDPQAISRSLQSAAEAVRQTTDAPAVVLQLNRGAISASTAAGVSDLQTNAPAAAQQTFEIGSQTKLMTAVAILQLVEAGKISLDARAATYLPAATIDGIANADIATVRQLLNMTAGIDNYTEQRGADGVPLFVTALLEQPDQIFGPAQALDLVRGLPSIAAPGTEFIYSNTNYTLLGQIIEGLSGKPFHDALNDGIFRPAGMTNTVRQLGTDDPRLSSYLENPALGDLVDVTRAPWEMRGEAGVVSTTADMVKFLHALLVSKTLLSAASLAEMTQFVPTGANDVVDTGFGLGLVKFGFVDGDTFYGFTGGTLGTASSTYVNMTTGDIISLGVTDSEADSLEGGFSVLQSVSGIAAWNIVDDGGPLHLVSGSARDLTLGANAQSVTFATAGAALTLDRAITSLTTQNVTFADRSVLVVGDNAAAGGRDDRANRIDILRDFKTAAAADNQIHGLGGNDQLQGGRGNDLIFGGAGRDDLFGRSGDDILHGDAGRDRLAGGGGDDHLFGGAGKDLLYGGAGNDVLTGGSGANNLWGGAGADQFVFDISDVRARETIHDFNRGEDTIDLTALSETPLQWVAAAAFNGPDAQLRAVATRGGVMVQADINGDGQTDFQLFVKQVAALAATDFGLL